MGISSFLFVRKIESLIRKSLNPLITRIINNCVSETELDKATLHPINTNNHEQIISKSTFGFNLNDIIYRNFNLLYHITRYEKTATQS